MGYRFTLESANTVANLTFGKVMSCYRDIYSSTECYEGFMHFLDQFQYNLYSNEMERYMRSVRRIREILHRYEDYKRPLEKVEYDDTFLHFHKDALDALKELSKIFERCTTKSLLLPPMKGSDRYSYDFMTSPRTFNKLFELHKGDSCLILQPQEQPYNATIFNAFPNFDHHLLPIPKPSYYNQKWFEKILPTNFMDMSLKLLDADLFFEWLHHRNVRIVLHGHKHIPFFAESGGITVIGCGSSTGQIVHKEKGKTYISYNMLKISEKTVTCTQFAEEVYGAGAKNIRTEIIEL